MHYRIWLYMKSCSNLTSSIPVLVWTNTFIIDCLHSPIIIKQNIQYNKKLKSRYNLDLCDSCHTKKSFQGKSYLYLSLFDSKVNGGIQKLRPFFIPKTTK